MRVLVVSPSVIGYRWEIEILARSVRRVVEAREAGEPVGGEKTPAYPLDGGIDWIAFVEPGTPAAQREADVQACRAIAETYGITLHLYDDDRTRRRYRTGVRPYLIARWLREDPSRQTGAYYYCDSDVLFRFDPPVAAGALTPARWLGSPTEDYAAVWRLMDRGQINAVTDMAAACRVDFGEVLRHGFHCPGAQWMIQDPRPEIFEAIDQGCEDAFEVAERYPIPAWLTDMWVTPWILRREGIEAVSEEGLSFSSIRDDYNSFLSLHLFHDSLRPVWLADNQLGFEKHHWRDEYPFGTEFSVSDTTALHGYTNFMFESFGK